MQAVDAIEMGLKAFASSRQWGSKNPPMVGAVSAPSSTASSVVNTAPRITVPIALSSGNAVLGTTVRATVTASDNGGEAGLVYRWSLLRSPSGSSVTFTANNSNAAKSTTLQFNRAGAYELMVSAVDSQGLTASSSLAFTVHPVLTTLEAYTASGVKIDPSVGISTATIEPVYRVQGLDQFSQRMATPPTAVWSMRSGPSGGTMEQRSEGSNTRFTFSTNGTYVIQATAGNRSVQFAVQSVRNLANIKLLDGRGQTIQENQPVMVSGARAALTVQFLDQFGRAFSLRPGAAWTVNSAPTGGTPRVSMSGTQATITLDRVGDYDLSVRDASIARRVRLRVNPTLTSLVVTPSVSSIEAGKTQAFSVQGLDQFGQIMSAAPAVVWSATGGAIATSGVFTAGAAAGSATVRATSGTISTTVSISVTIPSPSSFQNQALAQLIQTYYVDQNLSRTEMMSILRSVGQDSIVDAVELTDLRNLVNNTQYVMPAHVRGLARNAVTDNNANLRFQGQAAGNLTGGSSAALLNKLVDKWFLGVDLPSVTNSASGYTRSTGTLFQVGPTLSDTKQGFLGDCYFLAALGSIANANAQAIRDMFDDNGDGSFTVRFFGRNSAGAASADYVTVDRRLPTSSGGTLVYAGYGALASSTSSILWLALAEKAYAQWNETGRAGRNGTNTYSALEGGWMANVNFQVLGYASVNASFATSSQQTLVNALASGQAVTAGTKSSVPSGLVAGHAYAITGYNSATGKFTLYNPWGYMHPSPMTWGELQNAFSVFTTTSATGSGGDVVSRGFNETPALMASPLFVGGSLCIDGQIVATKVEILQRHDGYRESLDVERLVMGDTASFEGTFPTASSAEIELASSENRAGAIHALLLGLTEIRTGLLDA